MPSCFIEEFSQSPSEEPGLPFCDLLGVKSQIHTLKATLFPLHSSGFQTWRRGTGKLGVRDVETLQFVIGETKQGHVEGDWEPGLVAAKGTAEPTPCAKSAMRKNLGTTRR